jgi:hypothetical protein
VVRLDPANNLAMVSAGLGAPVLATHIVRGFLLMPLLSLAEGNYPKDMTNSF